MGQWLDVKDTVRCRLSSDFCYTTRRRRRRPFISPVAHAAGHSGVADATALSGMYMKDDAETPFLLAVVSRLSPLAPRGLC